MAATTPPVRAALRPREKTIFRLLPAPRLNWVRLVNETDALLPVFGLFSEANSCRIPGSHSRATFYGPRAAQAKVSRHAHVGSMSKSFPCPFGREASGGWESVFHPRPLPKADASFLSCNGL